MDPTQTGAIFHRLPSKLNLLLCCFFYFEWEVQKHTLTPEGHLAKPAPQLSWLSPPTHNHRYSYSWETLIPHRSPSSTSFFILIPTFLGMSERLPYGFIATLGSLPSEPENNTPICKRIDELLHCITPYRLTFPKDGFESFLCKF